MAPQSLQIRLNGCDPQENRIFLGYWECQSNKVALANMYELLCVIPALRQRTIRTPIPFWSQQAAQCTTKCSTRPTSTPAPHPFALPHLSSCVSPPAQLPSPRGHPLHYCRPIYSLPPPAVPSSWNTNGPPASTNRLSFAPPRLVGTHLSLVHTRDPTSNVGHGGRRCGR